MDLIGINVNKIPDMKAAVETYVGKVNTEIAKLENVEATLGFKGDDIVPGFTGYIATVIKASKDLVSNLNVFKDKLVEIQEAYAKKDEANASILTEKKETASSLYSEYTIKYGEGGTTAK